MGRESFSSAGAVRRAACLLLGGVGMALAGSPARAADVSVVPTAPFTESSRVTPAVREQCGLETLLPQVVADESLRAELGSGGARILQLRITEVQAPGGGMFSGPKWLEVAGELREGGLDVGSFRAKRVTSGGPFGGGGTCGMLQKCARAIAKDVAVWLESPTKGAELGDAR